MSLSLLSLSDRSTIRIAACFWANENTLLLTKSSLKEQNVLKLFADSNFTMLPQTPLSPTQIEDAECQILWWPPCRGK